MDDRFGRTVPALVHAGIGDDVPGDGKFRVGQISGKAIGLTGMVRAVQLHHHDMTRAGEGGAGPWARGCSDNGYICPGEVR